MKLSPCLPVAGRAKLKPPHMTRETECLHISAWSIGISPMHAVIRDQGLP